MFVNSRLLSWKPYLTESYFIVFYQTRSVAVPVSASSIYKMRQNIILYIMCTQERYIHWICK